MLLASEEEQVGAETARVEIGELLLGEEATEEVEVALAPLGHGREPSALGEDRERAARVKVEVIAPERAIRAAEDGELGRLRARHHDREEPARRERKGSSAELG